MRTGQGRGPSRRSPPPSDSSPGSLHEPERAPGGPPGAALLAVDTGGTFTDFVLLEPGGEGPDPDAEGALHPGGSGGERCWRGSGGCWGGRDQARRLGRAAASGEGPFSWSTLTVGTNALWRGGGPGGRDHQSGASRTSSRSGGRTVPSSTPWWGIDLPLRWIGRPGWGSGGGWRRTECGGSRWTRGAGRPSRAGGGHGGRRPWRWSSSTPTEIPPTRGRW